MLFLYLCIYDFERHEKSTEWIDTSHILHLYYIWIRRTFYTNVTVYFRISVWNWCMCLIETCTLLANAWAVGLEGRLLKIAFKMQIYHNLPIYRPWVEIYFKINWLKCNFWPSFVPRYSRMPRSFRLCQDSGVSYLCEFLKVCEAADVISFM